jgi:hypothetical protein
MVRALCRVGPVSASGYIVDALAASLCFCCIIKASYVACLEMSPRLRHPELQLLRNPELHAIVPRMHSTFFDVAHRICGLVTMQCLEPDVCSRSNVPAW